MGRDSSFQFFGINVSLEIPCSDMFCKWFLFKRFFEKYIPFRFFGRNQIQTNSDSDKSSFRVRFRHIYGKKRYICIWICLHLNLNLYESEFVWIWFLPRKIWGKSIFQKIWREITTKKYLNKFSTKESLKRHSRPQDWKEESLPIKIEKLYCKVSSKACFLRKTLKRNPYQTNFNRMVSNSNPMNGVNIVSFFPMLNPVPTTFNLWQLEAK